MTDWQPIETAEKPKSGRVYILLWAPTNRGRPFEGYWGFNGHVRGWICSQTDWPSDPTHWMPLPDPPKD